MGQTTFRFALASMVYAGWSAFARMFLVYPAPLVDMGAFLPPLLGLALGPGGAVGVCLGYMLVSLNVADWRVLSAFLFLGLCPSYLWHKFRCDIDFAFNVKCLLKLTTIITVVVLLTAIFLGLTTDSDGIVAMLANSQWQLDAGEYPLWLFWNNLNVTLLFGLPAFFLMQSYGWNFYRPGKQFDSFRSDLTEIYRTNRLALAWLYAFFVGLFVLMDTSGIFLDLDQPDVWMLFNGEIMTMMNLVMFLTIYMLLRYRRSIMTHLMMLGMAAVFFAALFLGSISFAALSTVIDADLDNDLQKMSVIYRERLVRSFNEMLMATGSMANLASDELESYEKIHTDPIYRRNYLQEMEKQFISLAKDTSGTVGCYMNLSEGLGGESFLCTRQPERWGMSLPNFSRHTEGSYDNLYRRNPEQHMAKLSEPYFNKGTGKYMISYIVPVTKGDDYVGLVGLDMDFDFVIHEVKRMSVYEQGFVRLIDKNGVVLYSDKPSDTSLSRLKGYYETETYLSNGIWLCIASSAHEVYAARNRMLIHLVFAAFSVFIGVTLFSIWLAGKGLRPLASISSAAKQIAAGDLDVKIDYPGRNELGTLVRSIKEMAAKLEIHVYHDKMTGVYNPAAYARKMAEMKQSDGMMNVRYAVLVFDANFLKRVNDRYGHEAGNELIIRAAALIAGVYKNSPVFRVGGDEFAVILTNDAYEHREGLLREFDRRLPDAYFMAGDERIDVSVARGMAVYQPGSSFEVTFKAADVAMYQNKAAIKQRLGIVGR